MDIKRMLPFLEDEELEELAKKIQKSPSGEYQGLTLSNLLPFLDDDVVDEMFILELRAGHDVHKFLPFVSDEILSSATNEFIQGKITSFPLKQALPFMEDEDVTKIAKKCLESGEESFQGVTFKEIMPFLDDDVIGEIFLSRVKNGGNYTELLPFVDDDVLSQLVNEYIKSDGKINLDVDSIYPFLDDDDIKKLFRYKMSKDK